MRPESIVRSQSLPAALSRRAECMLRLADNESNSSVEQRYRVNRTTVPLSRKPYAEHCIAGLHDERKSNGRRSRSDDEITKLMNTALTRTTSRKTQRSRRSRADGKGLPKSTANRYLTPFGSQPNCSTSFKLSNGPYLIQKMRDIVALRLNPTAHTLALCVDEKSPCQGLERTRPVFPTGRGYVQDITHNYVRHSSKTMLASPDVTNGAVLTQRKPTHPHHEPPALVRRIDARIPEHLVACLACDNYRRNQLKPWIAPVTAHAIRRG